MSVKASSQVSMLDITDAYSVTLTSEAFAFVGNTSGAPSGLSCATQVIAYCGTQRCSKVTIGTVSCPSGISASISNNGSNAPTITFTTTATITAACEATIPVTVDGVTINKKFSFAVAKTGATGEQGPQGPQGPQGDTGAQGYSFKVLISNYKTDQSSLESWATPGKDAGIWHVTSTSGVKVGDSVAIQCYNSSKSGYVYVYGTVTSIGSSTALNMISAGMTDKGDTGATGNGVSSSTVDYQVSSSGTTIPTGTWQPSVPSVSPGQYLWTRTILKYTNGSSSSASYSVGRMGTNGTDGSNGRGIKSTVVTYQAGSSGTSAPTGIWTSSIPATSASAPYLWSKTVITYTDNTPSTTYSVGSTPEGIVVGGRNLIINSKINETSNRYEFGVRNIVALENNTTYTFTVNGRSNPSGNTEGKHLKCYLYENSWRNFNLNFGISETVDTTRSYTFTTPSNVAGVLFHVAFYWFPDGGDRTGNATVNWCKLEKGNKATDWTPAPEDLETRVATAESKIDKTDDKISLVVKSGDSESNMVLTDKVCQLVANNINLNGRVTISGLDYDAQTKINNAYNWTNDNGGNMTSLLSMVKKWTNNAVSDTTTIQGGWIATNTITADKIAIGDFTNYCDLNQSTASMYGFTVVTDSSASNNPWLQMNYLQRDTAICPNGYVNYKCNGGESFRIKFQVSSTVKENSSGNFMDINVGLYCHTDTGANAWIIPYGVTSDANGTVKTVSVVATLPTNVRTFSVYLQISGSAPFSGVCKVRNISVTKMSSGELIVDGAITANQIAANAITSAKIAANAITATQIAANAVTATHIAANAVTATHIAANAITADKIAAGAITAAKIAAGAITADKLAANAITADKLAANAITGKTISGGSININDKFQVDTSGNLAASGGIYLRKLSIDESGLNTYIQSFHDGLVCNIYMKAAGKVAVISASESHYVGCVASCDGFNITGTTHANAILPESNATYALGEGGSKGWSNIYIGNASNTYNGLRIINGTTNYNLCGINSSNTMIFGDPSWAPYIYVKNTSTPPSGAVQSFTIGDNGSTTINDAHVWLYGRNDTTSRYIGSYLVYARTYGSAANVVVTANGVLGRSTSSSKRYKHDIREFSVDEVSCLYDLPLKKFKYNNDYISKDDEYYNKDLYGFIVEDLDEVLPISVQHNLDDDAEYTIPEMWNNNIIVPCLLKLIQDLNNRLKKVEEGKEN